MEVFTAFRPGIQKVKTILSAHGCWIDGQSLPPSNFIYLIIKDAFGLLLARHIPRAGYRRDIKRIYCGRDKRCQNFDNLGYTNEVCVTPDGNTYT